MQIRNKALDTVKSIYYTQRVQNYPKTKEISKSSPPLAAAVSVVLGTPVAAAPPTPITVVMATVLTHTRGPPIKIRKGIKLDTVELPNDSSCDFFSPWSILRVQPELEYLQGNRTVSATFSMAKFRTPPR